MRIYLQSELNESGNIRFVNLVLQQDLVSGWTVIRETGVQGFSGTVNREHFEDQNDALEAMLKWRDRNIRRGYRIAFVHGDSLNKGDKQNKNT